MSSLLEKERTTVINELWLFDIAYIPGAEEGGRQMCAFVFDEHNGAGIYLITPVGKSHTIEYAPVFAEFGI